jgi:[acyl-carrier-protein] S-malonyltransferase
MASPQLSFLFPGQGSQSPGMGRFLFENFPLAKQTFEEASDTLSLDLKKLCFFGSDKDLALTENTQPCLLVVSTATQRVLRSEFSLKIGATAGHSIGEYASLVLADVLPFTAAVKAVRLRGEAMQSAVPVGTGGMVAVMGLEPSQVQLLCDYIVKKSGFGPLSPANYNSPGQIVISGSQRAIEWSKEGVKAEEVFGADGPKRLKLIPLQVSAPFHCEMMKPAENTMRSVLNDIPFQNSLIPVLQNFPATFVTAAEALRENLIRQVSAPVKWMQSMELLKERQLTTCIECGAGTVVKGLLKKIDSEAFQVFNTNSLEDLEIIEKFVNDGA